MMTGKWLAALAIASCTLGLAQQPAATEKASISGIVSGTDGKPLRRASVRLASTVTVSPDQNVFELSGPKGVTETDAEGNFTFENLASGGYSLTAERTGYLMSGQTVRIAAGQNITGLAIKLLPQSIIAGRIVDDEGEILPGATVKIEPYMARTAQPATGTTDADGAFSIGGLNPGRYLVSVTAPSNMTPSLKSKDARKEVYVPTYLPDAIDRTDATPVELAPGAQARGLELKLQKSAVFKISGKVIDSASGQPMQLESLSLLHQGDHPPGLSAHYTSVGDGGEFSFSGVLPGNYFLEAKPKTDAEDHAALVAWQAIAVADDDLAGVVLEMKPPIELRGKFVVEGPPLSSWPQITLTPADGLNYLDSPKVDPDGQFRMNGLEPALYNLTTGLLPAPLYIKSTRFNGRDIDGPIDLGSSPSASLDIVIARGASSLTGTVSDSNGPVGRGIPVFAASARVPFRATATDEKGQFSFEGLAPGQYIVCAMDTPGNLPPDFLGKVGTPVTVAEGANSTDLKLTTTEDLKAAASGLALDQ